MTKDSALMRFLRLRETGLCSSSQVQRQGLEQCLILNNSQLRFTKLNTVQLQPNKTKAFLISSSIDKCFFAVAVSDNSVGIYCAMSGSLKYKLVGARHTIYTISWHPYLPNVIGCSDMSGSVFVWDLAQPQPPLHFQSSQSWTWRPFLSMTYSLDFHPFTQVMGIARDREIRFVNWVKGHHIAVWRFYSEFSWVPWLSWSYVGSSLLVSVGNPQNNCVLHSIIECISQDSFNFSPVKSGCAHSEHNSLCELCDMCAGMSQLEDAPPSFEEYHVNCVDLIRFVLSRPPDWFRELFICVDCTLRFQLWANSIQIHGKYAASCPPEPPSSQQLPFDVDSDCVTVLESPLAPELAWDALQAMDSASVRSLDSRLARLHLATVTAAAAEEDEPSHEDECRRLLRCVAMFERECLRQSICWCCLQQLHRWISQIPDFPRFIYTEMLSVREMVIERCQQYDMNPCDMEITEPCEEVMPADTPATYPPPPAFPARDQPVSPGNEPRKNLDDPDPPPDSPGTSSGLVQHDSDRWQAEIELNMTRSGSGDVQGEEEVEDEQQHDEADGEGVASDSGQQVRLGRLKLALRMLQLYVSEPSRLGDIIDIMLHNDITSTSVTCYPYLNVSKIESYCLRRWQLQPLGEPRGKITPRAADCAELANVVVPSLVFSSTGLAGSSIRLSRCGRLVAVLVGPGCFRRLHHGEHEQETNHLTETGSKRRHSLAFGPATIPTLSAADNDRPLLEASPHPVVAVYSAEPETSCGQLLHYLQLPHDTVSLDFSPLGDLLLVGIAITCTDHSRLSNHTRPCSLGPLSSSSATAELAHVSDLLLVGAILEIGGDSTRVEGGRRGRKQRQRRRTSPAVVETTETGPRKLSLRKLLREPSSHRPRRRLMRSQEPDTAEAVNQGAANCDMVKCVIWNNAGGILYSRSCGDLYAVNYVGCTG